MSTTIPPAGQLAETITFLEMTTPPDLPSSTGGTTAIPLPTLAFYRQLMRDIGEPWLWKDRLCLSDSALTTILRHPAVSIHVLHIDEQLVGFFEIDKRDDDNVEIAFFGLRAEWIGQGIGRQMMGAALSVAWQDAPKRVWLHTSSYDHPGAIPFYQKTGFSLYRTVDQFMDDPRLNGILPLTAAPNVPLAKASITEM